MPVSSTLKSIYSRDRNLWHISHEGGLLEDPWTEPDEDMFQMTVSPEKAPDEPEYVEMAFEEGVPVKLNGKALSPANLIKALNEIGGKHGIGRVDLVENRLVGMKSRGVYETPGGTILVAAHSELEQITLDRETLHYKDVVAQRYAELVYNGQWFTPLREALDAFFEDTQEHVTGTVRLKLYKGNVIPAGQEEPLQPVPRGFRHLWPGQRLRPERRRRLHHPLRPAAQGGRDARYRRRDEGGIRIARITPHSNATESPIKLRLYRI